MKLRSQFAQYIFISLFLFSCGQKGTREAVSSSMAGHSRADYMTQQVMVGDFSGALNAAVSPAGPECIFPVDAPYHERMLLGEVTEVQDEPVPLTPERPRYHPEIEELINFFPANCGNHYRLAGANKDQETRAENLRLNNINCGIINDFIDGKVGAQALCASSQCQIAAFMGLIYKIKDTPQWPDIKEDFRCTNKAYNIFIGNDQVTTIAEEYNLGEGLRTYSDNLDQLHNEQGKPEAGDLMLFQRKSCPPLESDYGLCNSGHTGFFSHYEKSSSGRIEKICYWSSFYALKGYGVRCESIDVVKHIDSVTLRN